MKRSKLNIINIREIIYSPFTIYLFGLQLGGIRIFEFSLNKQKK